MASSDDEAEVHPQSVSNYHLEDDEKEPVSFSVLPIQWNESEDTDGESGQVFLDGFADNGLQKVFKHVVAWKFDVFGREPEISVLLKGRQWIKLEKPKKWFEKTIRTILITIHFLHYVQKYPETSAKSVWGYLSKDFSCYEVRPSQNDLLSHLPLIREAVKRNANLIKSQLVRMVLEKPRNVKVLDEEANNLARSGFIVSDDVIDEADDATDEADEAIEEDVIDEAAEEPVKDDELFDSVCVLCDNGGRLLCCDGICMRSFHATEEDGTVDGADCDSLGLTQEEVDEIQSFKCKNCEYNQHQCFVCGKLGNSDKSSCAEVFKCDVATCGRFYHMHCVAKELGKSITDGESFVCPIHSCYVCKERENKEEHELQFAVCRRCPKAYHRRCLPREIASEDNNDFPTRAWEGLLPNSRILIYCLKHEIDEELGTPIRDHIRFPKIKHAVQEIDSSLEEETKPSIEDRVLPNKNNADRDDSTCKQVSAKVLKLTEKSAKKVSYKEGSEHIIYGPNILRKRKASDVEGRHINGKRKSIPTEGKILKGKESQFSSGRRLRNACMTKSFKKIEHEEHGADGANKSLHSKPTNKEPSNTLLQLDSDRERRLLDLFKEATSSISLDDISKKLKFTYAPSLRTYVETITPGKLGASVDAVRAALKRLDEGKSIQDAEFVCDPDVLKQIFKWRIVDRLHWYVQGGDTIVDFSCGANDFSILMKKKLEETGKKCFYKNYDIFPTKNDFHFEMRDWMQVKMKELPKGSKLIMGLNPPFGVNGKDANMFIDKALRFQPKLLILTVPPETERLDNKRTPYDLVWEDGNLLSGKAFYLPGSLDVNERQMDQWNVTPPVLYLWSRKDWTNKHKAIAQEHGHLPSQRDALIEMRLDEISPADGIMNGNHYENLVLGHDLPKQDDDSKGGWASRNDGHEENLPHDNLAYGNHVVQEPNISNSDKSISNSEKTLRKKGIEENASRACDVASPTDRQAVNDTYDEMMQHSQERVFNDKLAVSPHDVNNNANENNESTSRSHMPYGRASHGTENKKQLSCAHSRFEYKARNFEEHHNSPMVRSPRIFGDRLHFRDEQHRREREIRQQIHLHGIQDLDYMRTRYQSGDDLSFGPIRTSYVQLGSDPRSSYQNTSAMQRYAPRLDELNQVRTRTLGLEPPITGRNGNFDHRLLPQQGYGDLPPQPGHGGLSPQSGYGGPRQPRHGGPMPQHGFVGLPPQLEYRGSLMGFSNPQNAYSHHHSAGWLNE
ncbi:protein ENHANCED DOWNY MILDEW 2 isoform X2 [Neltuma alba]|uniref:protein ENHANCED DOWNY MILDEW 2 isoform X2 n=1 Tax=Neltuma alba TaxID=207710 RepID=UPI0010A43104|nr:protein ENHANCED DOWNY MILDEW 2-like isoform X2 [Prosopis alba]